MARDYGAAFCQQSRWIFSAVGDERERMFPNQRGRHRRSLSGKVAPRRDFWDAVSNPYPKHDYMTTAQETANITWLDISDNDFQSTPPSQGKQEVIFLPYRDYTKELHTLHRRECTHYCANPYILKPIWRGIRLAMQRTAKYYPMDPVE